MGDEVPLLFQQVANLTPAQRAAYFNERQVPPPVRTEVESLLKFDSAEGGAWPHPVPSGARRRQG